jgi:hypothetical protein
MSAPTGSVVLASTTSTNDKSPEGEPIKVLFDLISYFATIWGFVATCLWSEPQALAALGVPRNPQLAILGLSTVGVFWFAMHRFKTDFRVRALIEQLRYVVVLILAALLGAYLQAHYKDQSYEGHLRAGAVIACTKIAACKESAAQYASTR